MEIWKDIEGFEGLYQISNYGNCRSLDRTVEQMNKWGKMMKVTIKGRMLKKNIVGKGYRRFDLCKNGEYTYSPAHRLVWETFIGKIPEGLEIDHIVPVSDGGGDELSNLRVTDRKGNMNNPITLPKMKKPCAEETKIKLRIKSKGKHYSPATEFKKGQKSAFKGKHNSEERRKMISKRNSKRVDQIDPITGEVINSFKNATTAAETLDYSICGISGCAVGRLKHYKGFLWRYHMRLGLAE